MVRSRYDVISFRELKIAWNVAVCCLVWDCIVASSERVVNNMRSASLDGGSEWWSNKDGDVFCWLRVGHVTQCACMRRNDVSMMGCKRQHLQWHGAAMTHPALQLPGSTTGCTAASMSCSGGMSHLHALPFPTMSNSSCHFLLVWDITLVRIELKSERLLAN